MYVMDAKDVNIGVVVNSSRSRAIYTWRSLIVVDKTNIKSISADTAA